MTEPLVDVIIVTYRSEATVADAVASAKHCRSVGRVIVIDNASPDAGLERAREAGADAVLAAASNVGFAAAVNAALPEAEAPYTLLLNPDAVIADEALEQMVGAMCERESAVIAGPLLVAEGGQVVLGARRFSTFANRLLPLTPVVRRLASLLGPEYRNSAEMIAGGVPVTVDYVWGASALVRRTFIDAIGGLDRRYFLYSEDEDLGRQAKLRGRDVILVPAASVAHVGAVSSGGDRSLVMARQLAALCTLFAKWCGGRSAGAFRILAGCVLASQVVTGHVCRRPDRAERGRTLRLFLRLSEHGEAG